MYMKKISFLFFLMLIGFLLDLSLGSVLLPVDEIVATFIGKAPNEVTHEIILNYRLPKAITAILTGAALSVGGVLMQTLFRNPLAGPDVLGVNSGAGLGVALFTMFGLSAIPFIGNWGIMGVAILGALLILLLVLSISFRIKENTALLIIGIMIGNLAGALISILQSVSNPDSIKLFIIWTFGSLSNVGKEQMLIMCPLILAGLFLAFMMQKPLNVLMLGDNYAQSLGIDIKNIRIRIIIATALLAGTATAFTGPIAFIGIAVPHITRGFLMNSNHRYLIPGSALCGAALMLFCDVISQLPGLSMTLPINSVTALFGAPVIIWVLFRNRRSFTR